MFATLIYVAPGKGILSLSVTIPVIVFRCCNCLSIAVFFSMTDSLLCFLLSSVVVLE